jgi:hypothetical protein
MTLLKQETVNKLLIENKRRIKHSKDNLDLNTLEKTQFKEMIEKSDVFEY